MDFRLVQIVQWLIYLDRLMVGLFQCKWLVHGLCPKQFE